MDSIQQSRQPRLPGFREKTLEPGQCEAAAGDVDDRLIYTFNNCDLRPDVDGGLHKLLAFISRVVPDLRSEDNR